MNNKIAIVNSSSFGRIFEDHLSRLEKIGEVKRFTVDANIGGKELAEILQGYNYIIASVTPFFTKEFFDNKDELKIILRHGIGFNNIDVEAAKEHGTYVSIVPPLVERDAVAENCITNLLSIMRKTKQSNIAAVDGKWKTRAKFIGNGLSSKKVGIIGIGNIGSRISEILYYGFRCKVLAYDPNKDSLACERFGADKVDLDYLLKESDIICVSASLNEENYHMLSSEEFSKMKDGVYISNCSRGALIDEESMIEALEKKKVAGFASDVLEVEPPENDHKYFSYDNVIITPHTSAYTYECLRGMGEKCVSDCEAVYTGNKPKELVN